ncbi:MAG: Npt1/Npt2 family nucleotide transporter [Desulfobacteraceae bacterium]
MRKKLLEALAIYEEELILLLWTAALLFLVRSSGMVLNNYAETVFLKRFGVEYMPIVNMLNAIATFVLTGVLTAFMGRVSEPRLLSYLFVLCGLSVAAIRIVIPFEVEIVYPLLFMLKSQFELLQALLFWNIANDLFNTRQSKRLFPLLTAGGVVGLIAGSLGTPFLAGVFGFDNLLYVYMVMAVLAVFTVKGMGRRFPTLVFAGRGGGPVNRRKLMVEEIRKVFPLIKKSALVKIILVLTFMPNVVIPIMNYQFNFAIDRHFVTEGGMITFFGYFRGILNIISLFILLFVGRIYGRWGVPVALMFHPFNYIIAFTSFLLRFDVFSAVYARMSTNIIRTTINMPANAIMVGLFPDSYRSIIRPFLRGTVVRAALLLGSALILVSQGLFHPRYLSFVAFPFLLAWLAAPVVLKMKYPKILLNLISTNLMDIKAMETEHLARIFKGDKINTELRQLFLDSRGSDAVWYARLLKTFFGKKADEDLVLNLDGQDDTTRIELINMLSPESIPSYTRLLAGYLDPEKPELTISVLKRLVGTRLSGGPYIDAQKLLNSKDRVVCGMALALMYNEDREKYGARIASLLAEEHPWERRSGIVAAGGTCDKAFVPELLRLLSAEPNTSLIPDIIEAIAGIGPDDCNSIIRPFLSHPSEDVRLAALNGLSIEDDITFSEVVNRIGDDSGTVSKKAGQVIRNSEYRNNTILIQALGEYGKRLREGVFELLEDLDIKDLDLYRFARKNIESCHICLAMGIQIETMPDTSSRALVKQHLFRKKEVLLENVIRVLAIQDKTGRMQAVRRGVYSTDRRQRSNAIELMNESLDKRVVRLILPLLESPSPAIALEKGKKEFNVPDFDDDGKILFSMLFDSKDWTDIVFALVLAHDNPNLIVRTEGNRPGHLESAGPFRERIIQKEIEMIEKRKEQGGMPDKENVSAGLSLAERILLLKGVEIFSGLYPGELAAISSVTEEVDYEEGEIVIRQGDSGDTVFLVVKGMVEVLKDKEDGTQRVLDRIGAGDAFGEMALLEGSRRSATIRTMESSRFLTLHKQEFNETVMEYPGIALKICAVLSRRIRHLHGKLDELAEK